MRTKRGFCSFLSSETRAHTHTNLEKGEFFFSFFCLLSSDNQVNFTAETLHTAALFFSFGHSPKSHSISLFYFFSAPRSLCVFFSADKRRTHAHTREKNEWQSNKIMLRHASVTTRRRSFDAVVNAARAVSVFLTQKNFHFSFSFPELFFLSESAMK